MRFFIYILCFFSFLSLSSRVYVYAKSWPNIFYEKITFQKDNNYSNSNRDNCHKMFFELCRSFYNHNIDVWHINSFENIEVTNDDILICNDIEFFETEIEKIEKFEFEKRFLIIWEPPTVRLKNYNKKYQLLFFKQFTILDDIVDNKRSFKIFEPFDGIKYYGFKEFNERRFLVMIAGNKKSDHPYELYSKRRAIIDYFETNKNNDFHLYGFGWPNSIKNYQGFTNDKVSTFGNYKFSVCFENAKHFNGYITGEKILASMSAGCVPIFWGADNITDYIPENCFIDARKFKNEVELIKYLKRITKADYEKYIYHINNFLNSKEAFKFSPENFVFIICSHILQDKFDIKKVFNKNQINLLGIK